MKGMIKCLMILFVAILSVSLVSADEVLNLRFDVNDLSLLSSELTSYEHVEGDAGFRVINEENSRIVTLNNVGSGGAINVDVSGFVETISANSIELVNGVWIQNVETFYDSNDVSQRSAILTLTLEETILENVFLMVGDSVLVEDYYGDIAYTGDLFYEKDNLALFLGNANWQGSSYNAACYTSLPSSNIECLYVRENNFGDEVNVYRLTQEASGFETMNVLSFEQVKMSIAEVNEVVNDNLEINGGMIDDKIFIGDLSIQNLGIVDGRYFGVCFIGDEADCYVSLKEEFEAPEQASLSSLFCDYLDCGNLLNVKLDENGEVLNFISMTESVGSVADAELYMNLFYEGENKGSILFNGNWILNNNGNEYFYGDSDIAIDEREYDDVLTFCKIDYPFMECGFNLEAFNGNVVVSRFEHTGGNNLEVEGVDFESMSIASEERIVDVYSNNEKIGVLTAKGYFVDEVVYFGEIEMDDGEVTGVYDGVCEIDEIVDCYVGLREERFNEIGVNEQNTGESNNYNSDGSSGSSSGSNNGGDSSGGSCYEEWECGEWTECSNGLRNRSCWEVSLCKTENFKPELEESCGIIEEEIQEDGEDNLITGAFLGMGRGTAGILIGIVILAAGFIGTRIYFRRRKPY